MRRIHFALFAAVAFTACVAVVDYPPPHQLPFVHLVQIRPDLNDPLPYGPIGVVYEMTIFNPSDRTLFVHTVDLSSNGAGVYHVAAQTRRVNVAVPPHENTAVRLRVSAWATGSQASAYEPLTVHGTLRYGRGQSLAFNGVLQ